MRNTTAMEPISNIYCKNEYDSLHKVITVPPKYMKIKEIINETQTHYADDNIDVQKATAQHHEFINALIKNGAEVIQLEATPHLNEQVFTRDIGFVVNDHLFVSHMQRDIRKKESLVLKEWLQAEGIPFTTIKSASIEGGDVIVDNKDIWIGQSKRTSETAIAEFTSYLPNNEVHSVALRDDILHLDCIFNVLENGYALIYKDGMDSQSYQTIQEKYKLIEVTEEEQFHMAPNVLSIGKGKIISLPENKRVNDELSKAGFDVIEVDFSEIIKSGGSFRCCTLPISRG
ncbi:dimethylarginine dimethylaminohydrolase family protein [Oceanobacillus sp. 1P07AA]|uniref:dimethylarginine dimethylaminohydrolase family protein n=1 Tax=Oceanobacillus sp. 1P07AA TaxID=3132293 RepID=UPI0039A41B43